LRDYFLKVTSPMPLLDAKSDAIDVQRRVRVEKLALGRQVFAANCIVCHSSIQPESGTSFISDLQTLADYQKNDRFTAITLARKEAYEPALTTDSYGKPAAGVKNWELNHEMWDHDPGQWLRDPRY
jgi:mono/diheme cytochrome c family protein